MSENLVSTKKCPSCQQWSEWQQRPDDRCTHCGEVLDLQAQSRAEKEAATATEKASALVELIQIRPEDKGLVWLLKWLGRGGQLLFIAILSFFIWLVTLAAA